MQFDQPCSYYRSAKRRVGYNHFISKKREWNNCFIENNQDILLHLANFALQEQPWYNGPYTMAAKPIKIPVIALYNDPVFFQGTILQRALVYIGKSKGIENSGSF